MRMYIHKLIYLIVLLILSNLTNVANKVQGFFFKENSSLLTKVPQIWKNWSKCFSSISLLV